MQCDVIGDGMTPTTMPVLDGDDDNAATTQYQRQAMYYIFSSISLVCLSRGIIRVDVMYYAQYVQ